MDIKVITAPDRAITQKVLNFQFRFMEWSPDDMEMQQDRWSSLPFGYVLADEGDKLIGTINILERDITFNGKKIKLGGIGGVATHTEYRRKGVASAMLTAAVEIFKTRGIDMAFLDTDIPKLGEMYGKVGFVPLNREYKATGLSGKIYTDNGGMIASINSPDIFNEVLSAKEPFDLQGQDW